jgi:hypothetical protein
MTNGEVNMEPFAEIEVTPLYSRDGMRSAGKSVRIADAESGAGWSEIGVVSPNYMLVHNARVKEVVDQIADRSKVGDWHQRKLFFDGRRFVYSLTSRNLIAEITPGDVVAFGLIAYNSYDGSRALSVGAYAEHLVCTNGMTSETYFARFVFRHHRRNLSWDEQTEQAFLAVMSGSRTKLTRFATLLRNLRAREMSVPELRVIRGEHLKELGVGAWGKVVDRFLKDESQNAMGLLDACTAVFWHNPKQSYSDYLNNSYATEGLIQYGQSLAN